ncbi:MAG: hydrogenase nickel incorporation protein HypA [endosymbiont of Galathealinum brachiosum]|uniref:Hydrogenase maturation factor HypA n=1 Tax=endosymbiont of Galathealinum brachiosum TaxID=2200906 RepID=A0A370DGA8_9GAMM|nr:MAG: hydrogenase nickel incorporation protein HypA [endosymbiont of Galathealinum brachiosum]
MHELAICQSLMEQVEKIAHENNAQSVFSITLGMGPLSGVEEQLLKNAYPVASVGSIAENAELIINLLPLIVKCNACNTESEVLANKLLCKQCGDWKTTVISGDELMLMSVELDRHSEQKNRTVN